MRIKRLNNGDKVLEMYDFNEKNMKTACNKACLAMLQWLSRCSKDNDFKWEKYTDTSHFPTYNYMKDYGEMFKPIDLQQLDPELDELYSRMDVFESRHEKFFYLRDYLVSLFSDVDFEEQTSLTGETAISRRHTIKTARESRPAPFHMSALAMSMYS